MTLGLIPFPAADQLSETDLAYFKYKGKLVTSGYLDARKAAETLQGIDEVMRFFLIQTERTLAGLDFDIPVTIRQGGWEAAIPHGFSAWLAQAVAARAAKIANADANQITEQHLQEVKVKDLVISAVKSMKWVLAIGKHMGSLSIRKFKSVKFEGLEEDDIPKVGLENGMGEILYVPELQLEMYKSCPDSLFDKLVKHVEPGRELEVGLSTHIPIDRDDTFPGVTVEAGDKYIFVEEETEEVILFPNWKHGDMITIEGHVTRGNENANTIGYLYAGHVLTCSPVNGNITDYKSVLFTNCILKGEVDRSGQHNFGNEKRPHIKFESLRSIAVTNTQLSLF